MEKEIKECQSKDSDVEFYNFDDENKSKKLYICKRRKLKNWLWQNYKIKPIGNIPAIDKDGFVNWVYWWDKSFNDAISEYFNYTQKN